MPLPCSHRSASPAGAPWLPKREVEPRPVSRVRGEGAMDTGDVVSDMLTILVQRLRRGVAAQLRPFGIYGDDLKWFTGNVQDAGCAGARQRLPNRTVAREVHIKAVSRGRHVGSAAIADPAAVSAPSAVESSADGPTSLPDALLVSLPTAARTDEKRIKSFVKICQLVKIHLQCTGQGTPRIHSGLTYPRNQGGWFPGSQYWGFAPWPSCLHACLT